MSGGILRKEILTKAQRARRMGKKMELPKYSEAPK